VFPDVPEHEAITDVMLPVAYESAIPVKQGIPRTANVVGREQVLWVRNPNARC